MRNVDFVLSSINYAKDLELHIGKVTISNNSIYKKGVDFAVFLEVCIIKVELLSNNTEELNQLIIYIWLDHII